MNSFYVTILFLFPLILSAGTIIVKTKAPHNRQSGEKNIRILPEHSEERHRWSDNPSAPDQRTIWFYRDSFGDAVLPYLTQIFRRTDSYHRNVPIRRSQFANPKKRPHIVVFQIVERNLRSLDSVDFESDEDERLELFR